MRDRTVEEVVQHAQPDIEVDKDGGQPSTMHSQLYQLTSFNSGDLEGVEVQGRGAGSRNSGMNSVSILAAAF
jgi:hypothetical protein